MEVKTQTTCNYQESLINTIKEVIRYSQGLNSKAPLNVKTILDNWYNNKKRFIDAIEKVGGKDYVYELPNPVTIELSNSEKLNLVDRLIDTTEALIIEWGKLNTVSTEEIGLARGLIYFLNWNRFNFFDNKVEETFDYRDYPTVLAGTKIIKAYKFFITDKPLLEKLQNLASEVIQKNKVEGKLCFSVHPLDYLTISENNFNWRSCHALDGEYRAGNLSYLQDTSTIVCYLKSVNDKNNQSLERLPEHIKWNSKKWRVLLYADPKQHLIFAGKQYPYDAEHLMQTINRTILPQMFDSAYTQWYNNYVREWTSNGEHFYLETRYFQYKGKLLSIFNTVKNEEHELAFNDVLSSTCYTSPYYCYNTNTWSKLTTKSPEIIVGSDVLCPCCGKHSLTSSESMLCINCDIAYGAESNDQVCECIRCGERMHPDDAYYDDYDDGPFCCDCYNLEGDY